LVGFRHLDAVRGDLPIADLLCLFWRRFTGALAHLRKDMTRMYCRFRLRAGSNVERGVTEQQKISRID
jgi:hypothetical protein